MFLGSTVLAHAQIPQIDTRIPSEGANEGHVAVRFTLPPIEVGLRYPQGAPLIVIAPGGQGVGGLSGGAPYAMQGFVAATFLFPGGSEGPFQSDGTYDYRGERCILALRDVLRYCGGEGVDFQGRSIEQLLPVPVLTGEVGLTGLSNGGPISAAVLGSHGAELACVAYYVGWENPTGGQTVAVEVGARRYDCDPESDGDGNGLPEDDGKNPYLEGYGPTSMSIDYAGLTWDPSYAWVVTDPAQQQPPIERTGILFLDGNANGALDFVPPDGECLDQNGNGYLDLGDDYLLRPSVSYASGALCLHYARETVQAAFDRDVYHGAWPEDVATPAESEAFWSVRDATRFYESLAAACPELRVLLAFHTVDHVQADDGHPHIQQAYDGFRAGDLWCRLNPDEAYYRLLDPHPADLPADHDANLPVDWPDMKLFAEPYALSSTIAARAGVLEMADRTHYGWWSPNLDAPLARLAPMIEATHLRLCVSPHPAGASSWIDWRTCGASPAILRCYDASGRLLASRMLPIAPAGRLTLGMMLDAQSAVPAGGVLWLELRAGTRRVARRVIRLSH
ncbi:MAG: hypothetical protein GF330_07065 [Candidatus Eisenbacteria bacterium]|nr:hypothetical protein [Candidatus Eisenbacteria bacterium]